MKLIPVSGNAPTDTMVFYQKTGILRYCNALGFKSICTMIQKYTAPIKFYYNETIPQCIFTFENDTVVHLLLQQKSNSNKLYIYGSAYVDRKDFHEKVILIAKLASKHIGCPFYLEDTTVFN